jgi:hypothetical protein
VTVSDETGWEFETIKRVYANVGLDKNEKATGVAWNIVKRSPDSTALRAEEVRVERLSFPIEPRDAKRFTIRAMMRYRYAPAPHDGSGEEAGAAKMAERVLTLPGSPRTTDSRSRLRGSPPWLNQDSFPHSREGQFGERARRPP